jgi:hypothetical protein
MGEGMMFRVIYVEEANWRLDPTVYETVAAAETAIDKALQPAIGYARAMILQPIAEFAPVTTIQRRPVNAYGVKEPTQ